MKFDKIYRLFGNYSSADTPSPSITLLPRTSHTECDSYVGVGWRLRNILETAYCPVDLPYLYPSKALARVVPYPSAVRAQTILQSVSKKCAKTAVL